MNRREKLFLVIFFLFILTLFAFALLYQQSLTDRVTIPSSGSIKTALNYIVAMN